MRPLDAMSPSKAENPLKAGLAALRKRVAAIEREGGPARAAARLFALDDGLVDAALGGGLARGVLHEIHAAGAGEGAAAGFGAALALLAAGGRPIVWMRQDLSVRECGELHPDGLAALGLDPAALILVHLKDPLGVLRAGVEAARCAAVGAAILEFRGEPKAFDLTAQRRLGLAAEASGVTLLLLRSGARPLPGSAETRWRVAPSPAAPLAMNAPGHPTFELELLRHRHGPPGGPWRLEWNRDGKRFSHPPLLRDPLALPGVRPAAPPAGSAVLRLAG
jgi:protein ImuA